MWTFFILSFCSIVRKVNFSCQARIVNSSLTGLLVICGLVFPLSKTAVLFMDTEGSQIPCYPPYHSTKTLSVMLTTVHSHSYIGPYLFSCDSFPVFSSVHCLYKYICFKERDGWNHIFSGLQDVKLVMTWFAGGYVRNAVNWHVAERGLWSSWPLRKGLLCGSTSFALAKPRPAPPALEWGARSCMGAQLSSAQPLGRVLQQHTSKQGTRLLQHCGIKHTR